MSLDQTLVTQIEDARPDLEDILVEVLGLVFVDEAYAVDPVHAGVADDDQPVALAKLEIHDPQDRTFTVVEVRLGHAAAVALTRSMLELPEPEDADLLDAVGELGNIAAGNVKSLLGTTARLSLPFAEVVPVLPELAEHTGVTVAAIVAGHSVQLAVFAADTSTGALWPGSGVLA